MSSDQSVPKSPSAYNDDEIDLFELFQSLWQEKILIAVVTVVVMLLAVAYALVSTPVYQAQASLVPPPAYAIQGYNEGRDGNREKEFTVEDIYKIYLKNLTSLQLRTTFFEEVYLPSLSADDQKNSRDSLMRKFNTVLSVKQSDPKGNPNLYQVVVELDDPVLAADWVKQYIELSVAATKQELRVNIEAAKKVRLNALKLQIKALLDTAKKQREDQIKLLKDALYIAESVGLEDASPLSDKASLGGNRYIDNDLIYTRGAKTLRAQLEVLESRTSDEPFIVGFRELNTQLELLQLYELDDSDVSVVQVDQAPQVPSAPIKPKKQLIVAVGLVLGGMLGVFAALIRSMIRNRKMT